MRLAPMHWKEKNLLEMQIILQRTQDFKEKKNVKISALGILRRKVKRPGN